jgi:hypothetical protein
LTLSELWSRRLALALLALGVLGLLVWLPRRVVRARSWALFRCLVPAWRFFEHIEPVPSLHYRVAPHGDDWSDWRDALTAPARTPLSLLLNAAGNLHLAQQSLIEHLVAELEDAAELGRARDELVSYRLVCALIEQNVHAALPASPLLRYQFRLSEGGGATLFASRVHGSG